MSSPVDATSSAEHQGLESWTLPGVTLFDQYCLYDLQLKLLQAFEPRGCRSQERSGGEFDILKAKGGRKSSL